MKVNYYSQNDIIKLAVQRKFENCEIESDLASMLLPFKPSDKHPEAYLNNISYSMFNAELVTRNNHHVLKAAPKTIPLRRRDRLNESSLKKYTYGKLNLTKFLHLLRQIGLGAFKLCERDSDSVLNVVTDENSLTGRCYSLDFDKVNKVNIDVVANQIDVLCDNEEYRVMVKDCLLKCLSTL